MLRRGRSDHGQYLVPQPERGRVDGGAQRRFGNGDLRFARRQRRDHHHHQTGPQEPTRATDRGRQRQRIADGTLPRLRRRRAIPLPAEPQGDGAERRRRDFDLPALHAAANRRGRTRNGLAARNHATGRNAELQRQLGGRRRKNDLRPLFGLFQSGRRDEKLRVRTGQRQAVEHLRPDQMGDHRKQYLLHLRTAQQPGIESRERAARPADGSGDGPGRPVEILRPGRRDRKIGQSGSQPILQQRQLYELLQDDRQLFRQAGTGQEPRFPILLYAEQFQLRGQKLPAEIRSQRRPTAYRQRTERQPEPHVQLVERKYALLLVRKEQTCVQRAGRHHLPENHLARSESEDPGHARRGMEKPRPVVHRARTSLYADRNHRRRGFHLPFVSGSRQLQL